MAEKAEPASVRSIAAKAGVSRTTVSLALRNDPRLPDETRHRIQTLAREMGYQPDPHIARLLVRVRARRAVKQTDTLGFVTSFPTRDAWRNESYVFREYFQGAEDRASQLGYRLEEIWAKEPGMTGRRVSAILCARGIRGLLIAPVPPSRGHLSLDWSQFVVATMGYSLWKPELHRVVVNYFQCGTLAIRELKRRGYHRIGIALPNYVDERINHQYLAAFFIYQHRIRAADRVRPLVTSRWEEGTFACWLRKQRPHAVLSTGDAPLRWIRSAGFRAPESMGFVHIQSEHTPTHSAGVYQSPKAVGAAAVDLVVGQLATNETGIPRYPKVVQIRGEWTDGPTVRPTCALHRGD